MTGSVPRKLFSVAEYSSLSGATQRQRQTAETEMAAGGSDEPLETCSYSRTRFDSLPSGCAPTPTASLQSLGSSLHTCVSHPEELTEYYLYNHVKVMTRVCDAFIPVITGKNPIKYVCKYSNSLICVGSCQ